MSLAQPGDPPRVPPVQQYEEFVEADMYQQLMAVAAPNEADVDVHHVRHAIVIFFLVFVFVVQHCMFLFGEILSHYHLFYSVCFALLIACTIALA